MMEQKTTIVAEPRISLAALRYYWPLVLMAGVVTTLIVVLEWVTGGSLDQIIIEALIRLTIVLGLYVFIGNTGIISFGHIGFVIIGAYATAWQTCCFDTRAMFMPGLPAFLLAQNPNPLVAIAWSAILAGVVAMLTGFALLRLTGIAASIGTFAFFIVVHSVYLHWDGWTAGPRAIIGIPTVTTVWSALAVALIAMVAAFLYAGSRSGISIRAARDDQVAALSSGVEVFWHRLYAFVLSAVMAGAAGGLMAEFLGMLSVSSFYLDMTFVTLSMLVLGGTQSLSGAVLGTVTTSVLIGALRALESDFAIYGTNLPTNSAEVGLGLVILLMLILRPEGICRNREVYWPFKSVASTTDPAATRRQS
jgi:branched-chain amino acid transport system permease protein